MEFIEKKESLERFCAELGKRECFAIDTEFIREKTYFPVLCLVQVAAGGLEAAIDPLACDIAPLIETVLDDRILKIFHSGRQDLEIIHNISGNLPRNVFDTQIAAMVMGYGDSVSYEALVSSVLGKKLDKSMRYSDWSKRPLSERQLDYAMSDVTFLLELHRKMNLRGREGWITEETAALTDPANYNQDPAEAWRKIKIRNRSPRVLGILREIAKWRDLKAREKNLPRSWIVKDELMAEIAVQKPQSVEELRAMRGGGAVNAGFAAEVVERVRFALSLPESELPRDEPRPEEPGEAAVDLLKLLLKAASEKEKIASKLIATQNELEKFALGGDARFLHGWRREIFGEKAEALLTGKIALRLKDGEVEFG